MSTDRKEKDFSLEDEAAEIKDKASSVSNPGKKKAGFIGLVIVCLLAIYYIFSSHEKGEDIGNEITDVKAVQSSELSYFKKPKEDESPILLQPKLPELPKISEMPAPPMPEPPQKIGVPQIVPKIPLPQVSDAISPPSSSQQSRRGNNRTSPMFAISGGGISGGGVGQKASNAISDPSQLLDPNKMSELRKSLQGEKDIATENSPLSRTSDQQVVTYVGNLNYIIAQGKMIDAVLETAIDTNLEGEIRAVISRDVYAESGDRVLIPKGSRLLGVYQKVASFSQSRVDIGWSRIILPWGIDIRLTSKFPGVDQLGRAGVGGIVDSKLRNIISTSLMLSSIKIGAGLLLNKLDQNKIVVGNGTTVTDTTTNSTKTTGTAGSLLMMDAAKSASGALTDYVNRIADVMPVIKVNQGTRLKVFVAKDVIFPKAAFNDYKVVE